MLVVPRFGDAYEIGVAGDTGDADSSCLWES